MKFISKGDIEAPTDFVYADMTDYEGWEKSIRKRNTQLVRSPGPIRPGTTWDTKFRLRGRDRDMVMTLLSETQDRQVLLTIADSSLDVDVSTDLMPLNPKVSRVAVTIHLRPRNLAAKLLTQSLRLARTKIQHQLDWRVAGWADDLSRSYAKTRQASAK